MAVVATAFGEVWEEVGVKLTKEGEPGLAVLLTKKVAHEGDSDQFRRSGLTVAGHGKLVASHSAEQLEMVVDKDVGQCEEVGQAKIFQKLAGSHNPSFAFFAPSCAAPEVIPIESGRFRFNPTCKAAQQSGCE